MERPRVLVMMATYDAGDLLEGQVESILAQEGVDVDLWISDDGSTDGTVERCEAYAEEHPNVAFRMNPYGHGAAWNFLGMVWDADPGLHDYYAYADQDDVWLPGKLARAVEQLREVGADALYYSNLENVAVGGAEATRPSTSHFRACSRDLGKVLVMNWAYGCTQVFDAGLLRLLQRHRPKDVPRYHDDWTHQVALAVGTTVPDFDSALIRHQQTGSNISGHTEYGTFDLARLKRMLGYLGGPKEHHVSRASRELLEGYGDLIHPEMRGIVETGARLDRSLATRLKAAVDGTFSSPIPTEDALVRVRTLLNFL